MTVTALLIIVGVIAIYAGWANLSMLALLRGDNSQPKPAPAKAA